MTPGTNGYSDTICVFCGIGGSCVSWRFVLGFVQFEADLGEVVELGDRRSFDLGLNATLEDTVKERVDVRFFGEVDEGFGIV